MSRVDEAMRRATEEARGVAPEVAATSAVTLGDQHSDALASEPFPIEMPEQRRQAANGRRLVSQLTSTPAADATKSDRKSVV